MIKYLLDTNICIYVIKQKPISILKNFNENANQMAISVITVAELLHGVEKPKYQAKNLKIVEDFISRLEVIDYKIDDAKQYGIIRTDLEKRGQIIGVNDLHIAANAINNGLIVVTNNTKEFDKVSGLRVENWIKNAN
jgi:tRNA(fMet)-specific endonuclease VapC